MTDEVIRGAGVDVDVTAGARRAVSTINLCPLLKILYNLRELELICIKSSYSSPVAAYGSWVCLTFLPDLVLPLSLSFSVSFCTGSEPSLVNGTPLVTAVGLFALLTFPFAGLRPVFLGGFIADFATILLRRRTVVFDKSSEEGSR